MVDVTHSTGRKDIMLPTAKAALAVGADGVMAEVHPDPSVALVMPVNKWILMNSINFITN